MWGGRDGQARTTRGLGPQRQPASSGWYPTNEGLASTATSDAIVFSDCGDYAVAVLSDAPSDFPSLLPVLDALNAAHGKMCGGSSALAQTPGTTVG